mmetsp:Transcript_67390/g.217596  ORF Transcript_67390/g.217596 Transcript_67390/m.217596 type:complete len:214 (+) Transcript_67390:192-833(+)
MPTAIVSMTSLTIWFTIRRQSRFSPLSLTAGKFTLSRRAATSGSASTSLRHCAASDFFSRVSFSSSISTDIALTQPRELKLSNALRNRLFTAWTADLMMNASMLLVRMTVSHLSLMRSTMSSTCCELSMCFLSRCSLFGATSTVTKAWTPSGVPLSCSSPSKPSGQNCSLRSVALPMKSLPNVSLSQTVNNKVSPATKSLSVSSWFQQGLYDA